MFVGCGEEWIDGGLGVDDRAEHAAFQASVCELCEVSLDRVEPARRGGGEVEDEAGMPAEPGTDLRVLVRGVVVEDHVDDLAGRHLGFEEVAETDELLWAVARHASADYLSVEYVASGQQPGGAMSDRKRVGREKW